MFYIPTAIQAQTCTPTISPVGIKVVNIGDTVEVNCTLLLATDDHYVVGLKRVPHDQNKTTWRSESRICVSYRFEVTQDNKHYLSSLQCIAYGINPCNNSEELNLLVPPPVPQITLNFTNTSLETYTCKISCDYIRPSRDWYSGESNHPVRFEIDNMEMKKFFKIEKQGCNQENFTNVTLIVDITNRTFLELFPRSLKCGGIWETANPTFSKLFFSQTIERNKSITSTTTATTPLPTSETTSATSE